MKINVGIVGYGNLGKAVEGELLKNNHFNLVAIFSRRTVKSSFGTIVEPFENLSNFKTKINIMLLCGGSMSDLEWQTREVLKDFDCINSFDTHSKIEQELKSLTQIAEEHCHRAIICCGWDPGLFSIIRGLFYAISNKKPFSFWGKGISLGHSDAIKKQEGVVDAVQFTIPNQDAIKNAKKDCLAENTPCHYRECYVVTNIKNKDWLANKIKNIPNYFKNQPTKVTFVSTNELIFLKRKLNHQGMVFTKFKTTNNTKSELEFKVKMQSNPEFTAKIMVAYINAVIKLKHDNQSGAYTLLDIPISYLFFENENKLFELC